MIVGHQHIQDYFLTNNPSQNPLRHHAYMFFGEEGVGKSHMAWHVVAHWLGSSVEAVQSGMHPDFRYMTSQDGKRIAVEPLRQVLSELSMTAIGNKRVLLIDCADDLGVETANALLKFLEEPPVDCYLILVSHQPSKLPQTVRSRLLPIKFNRLTQAEFQQVLAYEIAHEIADDNSPENQNIQRQDDALVSLQQLTTGRPGLFLRLYRQESHVFLQNLQRLMQNLPTLSDNQLQSISKDMSYEHFYCLSQFIANLLVQLASQSANHSQTHPYQALQHVPLQHLLQLWRKIQHYLTLATLPAGTGLNSAQIAYFILHSLSFLSKK